MSISDNFSDEELNQALNIATAFSVTAAVDYLAKLLEKKSPVLKGGPASAVVGLGAALTVLIQNKINENKKPSNPLDIR